MEKTYVIGWFFDVTDGTDGRDNDIWHIESPVLALVNDDGTVTTFETFPEIIQDGGEFVETGDEFVSVITLRPFTDDEMREWYAGMALDMENALYMARIG